MRLTRTLPTALILAVTAAACGGEPEADTMETDAAPAMTAEAPTSPCWLNDGTTVADAEAKPSPLRQVGFTVGGHDGTFCYSAPSANGREVMGALVPYGQLWRLGANEPTQIHLTGPTQVGGVLLQPGSYSIYAMPGAEEWTFYINSNVQRWGIPINDEVRAGEVGSFTATPEATDTMVEQLTVTYEPWEDGTMGDLVMRWENTQVSFHLHPGE